MISIIYKVGGDDYSRYQRLKASIASIRSTEYKDYEIILVEQSLNGDLYYEGLDVDTYYPIYDAEGFCVAWCGNVGARLADGDILIFMDADIIVEKNFLLYVSIDEKIVDFAYGGKNYWSADEGPSNNYLHTGDKKYLTIPGPMYNPTVAPYSGHGYIRIFTKDFYWNILGGHVEDFLGWGFEDTEIALHRIHYMLDKKLEELHCVDGIPVHLYHKGPREEFYLRNWPLFQEIISYSANDRCNILKQIQVGDLNKRKPILQELKL